MPCELCGREGKGCREAIIDGAKMYVCQDCLKFAEGGVPQEPKRDTLTPTKRFLTPKPKPKEKDIYADKGMEKELVANWNQLIEKARKKKGMTREQLGFRIGERTVTIAKLENGALRPSDQIIVKLQKELGIVLLEEVKTVPATQKTQSSTTFTLGDFIKSEK